MPSAFSSHGHESHTSEILMRQASVNFLSDSEEFLVELGSADGNDQVTTRVELAC